MSHVDSYLSSFIRAIQDFQDIVQNNHTFLIVGHTKPDGDCLWSMIGLWTWLGKQGKSVYYTASRNHSCTLDRVWWSDQIQYFEWNLTYELESSCQVVIFVDHSSQGQWSDMKESMMHYCSNKITVCLDHHLKASLVVDCLIVDESSSSACELLWEILQYIDPSFIDEKIASLCLLWLITDTGWSSGLKREKDSIRSFENALDMIRNGADKSFIINKLTRISLDQLSFTKIMFDRIYFFDHGIRIRAQESDWIDYHLDSDALFLIQSIMKSVENMDIVAVFTIIEGKLYGSLRTTNGINVQYIAEYFGWGWHTLAAGFRLVDKIYTRDDIQSTLIPTINNLILQQPSK